jgi:chromosomal replication initiator protein
MFAHAASLAVAEHPGEQYNPLYIYGDVGLGKTHLLHAIGHRALSMKPEIRVVYVSSEKFTNDLIDSIRAQRMDDFRSRYRTIDLLMIDDIQFIGGKDSTQEEFFHTFNTLYQSGRQLVISSDRPPSAIAGLEDRLRSRFEGGLTADVQPPDYEMRMAILRTKAEELGAKAPDEVVEYIAQRDKTNTRELEGALNRVIAYSRVGNRPITLALALEALSNGPVGAKRTDLTAGEIIDAVAAHFQVEVTAMSGRNRSKEIVLPRQIAMYLLREETSSSLADIGRALGGRDHTTVIHGIEKIESQLMEDAGLRSQIIAIRESLLSTS